MSAIDHDPNTQDVTELRDDVVKLRKLVYGLQHALRKLNSEAISDVLDDHTLKLYYWYWGNED